MELTGYSHNNGRLKGGISSIKLIPAGSVLSVEYDFENEQFLDIHINKDCEPATYDFKEGSAEYVEHVVCSKGTKLVQHRLTFLLEVMDSVSIKAVEEMASVSTEGIVAVISTFSGERLLVGYSKKFKVQRSMKLSSSIGRTGTMPESVSGESIILESFDDAKSVKFSGDVIKAK